MTLLKDTWYCAGWSTDVAGEPVHRRILGQDLVLFRDSQGKVAAMSDKCPHRFAPLHEGKVLGDTIACPYHGLRFDGTGTCVLNPHGNGQVPPGPHIESYLIEERNGTIWIWMGDRAKADPDAVIDTSFLFDREKYNRITDHHPIQGNYMLVVDNLLDLTHAQFLHPETVFGIGSDDRWVVNLDGQSKGEDTLQEVWFEETREQRHRPPDDAQQATAPAMGSDRRLRSNRSLFDDIVVRAVEHGLAARTDAEGSRKAEGHNACHALHDAD